MNLSSSILRVIAIQFTLLVLVASTLAVGMRLWGVPVIYRIDKGFSYAVDVLSLDNFYDEKSSMFTGETRSVTSFGYRFLDAQDGGVVLENFFDVRTVQGERIITIKQEYDISPYSREHISGIGGRERSGNLFAPRHLEKGQSFSYWHVNYDTKVDLVFEKEEYIHGLKVYRYSSSFGVDQTDNLTHLPNVPETRGVNLDVALTVWVEPVSGWLVKYEDSAIAYYYDKNTGKRLNPWNKFQNKYRRTSITEQVAEAKEQRVGILVLEILIPLGLFFVGVLFILRRVRREVVLGIGIVGVVVISGLVYFFFYSVSSQDRPFIIGISQWVPSGNSVYTDNIQGFKDALSSAGYREGREVKYLEGIAGGDRIKQEEIVQEFLEKNVDLVYSLTTTGTIIVKELVPNRPIVFSVVTYPVESGLVNSLTNSGNNLVGTRNWIPLEEQLDAFQEIAPTVKSIGFVHRTNELNSEIQFREMQSVAADLGIKVVDVGAFNLQGLVKELENVSGSVDALYSACDTLVQGEAEEVIITFAKAHMIPSFACSISGVFVGDLVAVAADLYLIGKLAGEKAVLILEGATPSSLSTDTVARPFIYINKGTAEELGLTIPPALILKAKEVINSNRNHNI